MSWDLNVAEEAALGVGASRWGVCGGGRTGDGMRFQQLWGSAGGSWVGRGVEGSAVRFGFVGTMSLDFILVIFQGSEES